MPPKKTPSKKKKDQESKDSSTLKEQETSSHEEAPAQAESPQAEPQEVTAKVPPKMTREEAEATAKSPPQKASEELEEAEEVEAEEYEEVEEVEEAEEVEEEQEIDPYGLPPRWVESLFERLDSGFYRWGQEIGGDMRAVIGLVGLLMGLTSLFFYLPHVTKISFGASYGALWPNLLWGFASGLVIWFSVKLLHD